MPGFWTQGRVAVGDSSNAMGTFPATDAFQRFSSATAAGLAGIVLAAKPGRLYRATVINGAATAYFLQFFNKATAPVNADVPVFARRLPLSTEIDIDLSNVNGWPFTTGIGYAISSTAATLTLAVSADMVFRAFTFTSNT